jgi:putative peptidoglycan lipid II flippase
MSGGEAKNQAPKKRRLAAAAGMISAATMLSRLLGLAREQLFAALLGASAYADAFNIAFRIPNLLRDLFAEGALAQAFVPTFKAKLKGESVRAAYDLANRVAATLFIAIGLIVLIAAIGAPGIVGAMAGDFREVPGKFDLTVTLTRIMLPFLPIISLAAVAMGMLNAQERYGPPALAPATFNVASIAVGTGLYLGGVSGEWVVIGWSIGTLLGGLCQLGIQLPWLWKGGFRPRPRPDPLLRDPGVRRVALLMLPAVGGLAAVQVNIFINSMFATTEEGAVSWLNYAFRFLQLPIGVFGVAIGVVSTTRYSDAAAEGDMRGMSAQLVESLRLSIFLTLPATIGLLVLGEPIIRLIFERGKFSPEDTFATARALEFYAVGLVAYASVKIAAPAFYAVGRAKIAVLASIAAVVGNIALNVMLHPIYGYRILALGTSAAAILNFTVLYVMFTRRIAPVEHGQIFSCLVRVGIASAIMGAAVWGAYGVISGLHGGGSLLGRAADALVPIAAGAIVYAAAAKLLGLPEIDAYLRRFRRRRRA